MKVNYFDETSGVSSRPELFFGYRANPDGTPKDTEE
jgi:hypothetical protein